MKIKGPRTYRREFPGEYVVVLLALTPGIDGTQILMEGSVSREFHDDIIKRYIDEMSAREKADREARMVDIEGLDKATVLATLYNGATKSVGTSEDMTIDEAKRLISSGRDNTFLLVFEYVRGRPLKVDLGGSSFDPWRYDRETGNGKGYAAGLIAALRERQVSITTSP